MALQQALFVTKIGRPPSLEWREALAGHARPGEIAVRIAASTLSWGDAIQATGQYVGGPQPPFTPGHDFAGDIVDVGPGVGGLTVGTRVFGLLPYGGALAQHVVMPASWASPTPDHVTDIEAAAVAASFFTADAALHFLGAPGPDDIVVIHAGAGGLGSAAIQLCAAAGVKRILATAGSAERRAFALSIGAHSACDYAGFAAHAAEFSGGRGVDLIIESIGGQTFDDSVKALARFGRLISVGASSAQPPGPFRMTRLWQNSLSIAGIHLSSWITDHPERLADTRQRVQALLAAGRIRAMVDDVIPAADVDQAFHRLSSRSVQGRIAIAVTPR